MFALPWLKHIKQKVILTKARINLNQALAAQPNNKLYRDALSDLDQRIAKRQRRQQRWKQFRQQR